MAPKPIFVFTAFLLALMLVSSDVLVKAEEEAKGETTELNLDADDVNGVDEVGEDKVGKTGGRHYYWRRRCCIRVAYCRRRCHLFGRRYCCRYRRVCVKRC